MEPFSIETGTAFPIKRFQTFKNCSQRIKKPLGFIGGLHKPVSAFGKAKSQLAPSALLCGTY